MLEGYKGSDFTKEEELKPPIMFPWLSDPALQQSNIIFSNKLFLKKH